jgi:formylglycine-generating enzyme required for sulfatase activity
MPFALFQVSDCAPRQSGSWHALGVLPTGVADSLYPYGNNYVADACNGNDFDDDCGAGADVDEAMVTGFTYGCPTPLASCEQTEWVSMVVNTSGVFDMSGNLKEWTATQVGSPLVHRIRGGAYDSSPGGLTCDFDFVSASNDFYFTNLGFRCCSN